jgi:hypothetical protein
VRDKEIAMNKSKRACLAAALAAVIATMTATVFAQTPFTMEKRAPAKSVDRYGGLSLGAVIRTDERYNKPGLFQLRSWDSWNRLENPKDYQNPNLWGDREPVYFVGQLVMPAGASLTIRGKFPHARYFKLAMYRFERSTFVALGGEDIAAYDIEPDAGSANPYKTGADRTVKNRSYTLHVVADDAPKNRADRARNTLYVGREGKAIQPVVRIYQADEGYDGAGLAPADVPSTEGPAFIYEAKLADGTRLSKAEVDQQWVKPLGSAPPPIDVEAWYALINSKQNDPALDPASAPARKDAQWELFLGMKYTLAGAFMPPAERAKIKLATEMEGGGDPTTAYLFAYLSRKFGPVYVFRAKMPTFPDTFSGTKIMPDGQVKYWSVVTAASAPSGELWDGVNDMMVPLDKDGYYTIVVSRPEDRPKNATRENGMTWIDWGPGEGLSDPRNRTDWGMLIMRFMVCQPDWENSPAKIRKPGTEAAVMGPYYPTGYYTTKAQFEAQGPKK